MADAKPRKTFDQYLAENLADDPALRQMYEETRAEDQAEMERAMADQDAQPVPLSAADMQMVRDTYAYATRRPQDEWTLEDVSAVGACAVLYIPRLLATLDAFEREVTAGQETIEKLLVRNSEYRDLVRAVVVNAPLGYDEYQTYPNYCLFCDEHEHTIAVGDIQHLPDCPISRARALLGEEPMP